MMDAVAYTVCWVNLIKKRRGDMELLLLLL